MENGVFGESMTCPKCGNMIRKDLSRWAFRCNNRTCDIVKSINSNTFFAGTKMKAHEILLLLRLWLAKVTVSSESI